MDNLEEDEEVCKLLLQLLTWLKQPQRKTPDLSPTILSLASMLTYYITGRRTTVLLTLVSIVHGMTRSKDLVNTLHKSGVCISYEDTLLLNDHWALMDVKASETCPQEIADAKPAIVIVDNDDFKVDTLTGDATGAHRTNVMFVQPQSYEKTPAVEDTPAKLVKKEISAQLKQKCTELTQVKQYKWPSGNKREPPVRSNVDPPINGTSPQRARSVIHALSRRNADEKRPIPQEQQVPAYSGAQSCRYSPTEKSKPYYHTTYNEPPSKSVLHDIMLKLLVAMREKSIPSLSAEQMAFFNDHFAQSMTGAPYSCQPMDLWIETTMNLNSKLKQGWFRLLQNEKQLFSTTRNANNVARVKTTLNRNLKCRHRSRKHVECQPARMKTDAQAI